MTLLSVPRGQMGKLSLTAGYTPSAAAAPRAQAEEVPTVHVSHH